MYLKTRCKFVILILGAEHYYTMTEYPGTVEKKVKLLNYFKNYMKEHLLKAGANMEVCYSVFIGVEDTVFGTRYGSGALGPDL